MKPIKNKRRPKSKNYFTQETEDAIILFNRTDDPEERSRIYEKYIHYPFFKLTQNIIHTFKFYHTDEENLEDIQHEIEIFLLSKLHHYDHKTNLQKRLTKIITQEFKENYTLDFKEYVNQSDKVTQEQINSFIELLDVSKECKEKLSKLTPPKAYSYFGTIVKRWLIIYNDTNYKKKQKQLTVNENIDEEKYIDDSSDAELDKKIDSYTKEFVSFVEENLYQIFPKHKDAQIADEILELFRKINHIDIFKKKAMYLHIKERIDVKTPKITSIAEKLYEIFKLNYVFLLENDYTHFTLPKK